MSWLYAQIQPGLKAMTHQFKIFKAGVLVPFPHTAVTSTKGCMTTSAASDKFHVDPCHLQLSLIKRPMISAWGRGSINHPPDDPDPAGCALGGFWSIASIFKLSRTCQTYSKSAYSKKILLAFPILMICCEGASAFPHLPWSSLICLEKDLIYKHRLRFRSTIKTDLDTLATKLAIINQWSIPMFVGYI